MKILYAPWRSSYVKFGGKKPKKESGECPFCSKFEKGTEHDAEHLILRRFKHCVVMLNLHPYNAGHVLVIPYMHVPALHLLTKEIRTELIEVTTTITKLYQELFACDGLNMGYNSGKASGGSVPEHMHIHVLPRFIGDTGFLAALANTKPISFEINTVYAQLKEPFAQLQIDY